MIEPTARDLLAALAEHEGFVEWKGAGSGARRWHCEGQKYKGLHQYHSMLVDATDDDLFNWLELVDRPPDEATRVSESDLRKSIACTFRRVDVLLTRHYTADERALWWHRQHPQLDGTSAIEAVVDGRGDEVEKIVMRLESGAYI